MSYQVFVQRLAAEDLEDIYLRAARRAPLTADRWLNRCEAALQSLQENPERCPLAPENRKLHRGLREFSFGRRPYVLRAIFIIEGDRVRILRIRRGQRRFLSRKELDQALEDE